MPSRRSLLSLISGAMVGLSGCNFTKRRGVGEPTDEGEVTPGESPSVASPSGSGEGILDVRDFGAEGDGTTDDASAIQRAIDSAVKGDTVYFPEPEAHYLIARSESEPIIRIDGEKHADQLTLMGDGRGTVVKLADEPGDSYTMVEVASPEGYSLEIRDLVLDGNKRNVAERHRPGICLDFRDTDATSSGRILVEDLEVRNANTSGIKIEYGGVECRYVTSRNNGSHGFGVSTNWSGVHDPPPLLKRCLSLDNARGPIGTGLDFSGGKGIAEDLVIQGANGNAGTKVSVGAIRFEYRRVRIVDNDGVTFQNTGNKDSATVVFDDVIGENNGGPCRLSDNANYHVPLGSNVVLSGNKPDERGQVYLTDSATLQSEGSVYSNRFDDAPGLHSDTSATGSYLQSYYYYETGRPIREAKNLTIRRRARRDSVDIETVPTAEEVGAWSRPH